MKTHGIISVLMLSFLLTGWITVKGQQQMEVPGDNFSLEGALELFKKSSSPKEFEVMLNDPKNRVNNLDLNGDGYIDFIRVIDMKEGNVHAFVLQAVISDIENQDIAVITLEKLANGKAVLQITGDEDIYGVETIIEPTREVNTNAGYSTSRFVVNVWSWPSVRYIYGPHYTVWNSPWGWYHRPHWWHTWRPVAYYDYYPYWRPYRHHYSICYTQRVVYAHHIYRPHRTTSVMVHKRHHDRITHYRSTRIDNSGKYRNTRNRSNDRQVNTAVRYDANGRIRSSSSQRNSSSSARNLNRQQGVYDYRSSDRASNTNSPRTRSSSEIREGSHKFQERSTSIRRSTSSSRSAGTSNGRSIVPQRNRTSTNVIGNKTPERTYNNGSRTNQSPNRSYSRPSEIKQRSSANTNIQRSNKRSTGDLNIRRSQGSSNVRSSTGSTNIKRSSGGSSIQRSSGSAKARSSSGSSSMKRSNGNSSVTRSSGNVSKNSSSSRSANSNNQSRGRR